MKNVVQTVSKISWVFYVIILTIVFHHIESPLLTDFIDTCVYLSSRAAIAALVYLGSLVIYASHPRNIFRNMLMTYSSKEFERFTEMPNDFSTLSARSILAIDLMWGREQLLQSPLMFTRFINVKKDFKKLEDSRDVFYSEYSGALRDAFVSYDSPRAERFIRKREQFFDVFFEDMKAIRNIPAFHLSKRREAIIGAFFKYYDAITYEITLMMEDTYVINDF